VNPRVLPFARASKWLSDLLRRKSTPLLAGALSALAAAYVWGTAHPVLLVHDEAAYLLQAKLYAAGRWTAPPAPIPEFFEQLYVFVSPFTAAKYPPGFPLALVFGVWLGAPLAVPIVLVGISGGLLFALARDVANESVAALAWLLWTTTPYETWPLPPFMSQHLSTALWLASWWTLLRWMRGGQVKHLVFLSFFLGWGAITRPLTIFAAAIPISFVVLRNVMRTRRWKVVLAPAGIVLVFLLLIPLWSRKTTGDWKVTPLALYVRWYTPYDGLGFGSRQPPERVLPADLREITHHLERPRRRHTISNLPGIVLARLSQIRMNALPGWRAVLAPIALYGLLLAPVEALFAALTGASNFAAHLLLAHPVDLPVYYFETYPILAFLAAWGIWKLLAGKQLPPSRSSNREDLRRREFVGFLLLLLALAPAAGDLYRYRLHLRLLRERKARFEEMIRAIPGQAIVFVRYSRCSDAFTSFVENDPDLKKERIWIVRDLGETNDRLRTIAPDRIAYLYLDASQTLVRMAEPEDPYPRAP
jgi:Dolichyl-phosphate-mannose-protein mannosyltransferase